MKIFSRKLLNYSENNTIFVTVFLTVPCRREILNYFTRRTDPTNASEIQSLEEEGYSPIHTAEATRLDSFVLSASAVCIGHMAACFVAIAVIHDYVGYVSAGWCYARLSSVSTVIVRALTVTTDW